MVTAFAHAAEGASMPPATRRKSFRRGCQSPRTAACYEARLNRSGFAGKIFSALRAKAKNYFRPQAAFAFQSAGALPAHSFQPADDNIR